MPVTDPPRLSLARLLAGLAVLSAAIMGAAWIVRAMPAGPVGTAAAVGLGLLVLPIAASPIEWLVHRYLYHRVVLEPLRPLYRVHHQAHHHLYFPTSRYVTGGPTRRIPLIAEDLSEAPSGPWANRAIEAAHFLFYFVLGTALIIAPLWAVTGNGGFVAGQAVALAVVAYLMIAVHDTIHRPGVHRWIERQPWFEFLDEHHFIHHVDTEANVNFLLPLSDWLFGTMRTALTAEERAIHGSREEAKAHPTGAGEPVRTPRRVAPAGAGATG